MTNEQQDTRGSVPDPNLTPEEAEALAYPFKGELPRDAEQIRREQEWRRHRDSAIDKLRAALTDEGEGK